MKGKDLSEQHPDKSNAPVPWHALTPAVYAILIPVALSLIVVMKIHTFSTRRLFVSR